MTQLWTWWFRTESNGVTRYCSFIQKKEKRNVETKKDVKKEGKDEKRGKKQMGCGGFTLTVMASYLLKVSFRGRRRERKNKRKKENERNEERRKG